MLTEALPGFRAWRLDPEGRLWPATASTMWEPGVNVARCVKGHDAPHGDCTCGLYAFHTVHRQLGAERVIGGIAAWGDMEVHRDGFRAGRAQVMALASAALMPPRERAALRRAAARYEVPVVPREALLPVVAERAGLLPVSVVAVSAVQQEEWLARRRGYDAEQQVWIEPGGGGVTLGISDPLRAWLGGELEVSAADAGVRVGGRRASVVLGPGVRGPVTEVNPDGDGWIARIAPTHWSEDCDAFTWGPPGRAVMLSCARAAGADGFAHLLRSGDFDRTAVTCWADVGRELRAAEATPVPSFASERDLYDDLGIAMGRALADATTHLGRLDLTLALAVREPDAQLVLDLRPGEVRLHLGGVAGARADVIVDVVGDDLRPLLAGRLDLAQATGAGRLGVHGPRSRALSTLAVVTGWTRKHLREPSRA